jgi:ferredoxin-type protein NapH
VKTSNKRILVQWAFFILFNAGFLGITVLPLLVPVLECFAMPNRTVLCNFGVLQRNLSFDWQIFIAFPLASVAMFIIFGAFFGRAMCGWACPLGFFQDVLTSVLKFFKRQQRELPQKIHYMLTGVKYVILFATLAIVSSIGITYVADWLLGRKYAFSLGICGRAPYCLICPVPILFVAVPSLASAVFLRSPFPQLGLTFYIGLSATVFFLALSLITKRSWCRYICPLGALMSFFNKFSLLHIKKKVNKCSAFCRGHQRKCNITCPAGILVSRNQEPSSNPDCILCYNCAESCPNNAVTYKLG